MKRTGLSRRTELSRRSALARSEKRLERGKPLRRVGRRGARHRVRMDQARPIVFARALWRCEARIPGVCTGGAEHAHHVLPRARGGPDVLDNLLAVCSADHQWIHDHPREATDLGLLRSGYTNGRLR